MSHELNPTQEKQPAQMLGLWDIICLIVGIVIGVGIFETPAGIFHNTLDLWQAMLLWVLGGFLTLVGALCFAELATAFPRSGGEYVYLSRGFGRWMGFLLAWGQFAILRAAGSIGVFAVLFAKYAGSVFDIRIEGSEEDPTGSGNSFWFIGMSVGAIAVFTLLNILGVVFGKHTQNTLTVLKVLGIGGIIVVGLVMGTTKSPGEPMSVVRGNLVRIHASEIVLEQDDKESRYALSPKTKFILDGRSEDPKSHSPFTFADLQESMFVRLVLVGEPAAVAKVESSDSFLSGLVTALILILWTYAGWHEAAYVVSEVEEKKRTIPWSLMLGTGAILVIYLGVNLAYGLGLGFEQGGESGAIAADLFQSMVGDWGATAISVLIVISCLGALNGAIFTSSRIYTEMGKDHPLFAPMGKWHEGLGTPVRSLVFQGAISIAMVIFVGIWFQGFNTFNLIVECTSAVFWLIFFLTGVALFILRIREPEVPRPFRVPLYPIVPGIFCLLSLGMFYASLTYRPEPSLIGMGILLLGVPLYFLSELLRRGKLTDANAK